MCCFASPAAAAIITSSVKKKIPSKYHLDWLNWMLWGGVAMLIIEHISHGEIVPFPPFITAMKSQADTAVMLQEIATIGTSMTVAIIIVWAGLVLVANKFWKIKNKTQVAGV